MQLWKALHRDTTWHFLWKTWKPSTVTDNSKMVKKCQWKGKSWVFFLSGNFLQSRKILRNSLYYVLVIVHFRGISLVSDPIQCSCLFQTTMSITIIWQYKKSRQMQKLTYIKFRCTSAAYMDSGLKIVWSTAQTILTLHIEKIYNENMCWQILCIRSIWFVKNSWNSFLSGKC